MDIFTRHQFYWCFSNKLSNYCNQNCLEQYCNTKKDNNTIIKIWISFGRQFVNLCQNINRGIVKFESVNPSIYKYFFDIKKKDAFMVRDQIIINFNKIFKIFGSKHNRIRELRFYGNMYVFDNECCKGFKEFLKKNQNNSNNNNTNYNNNTYDERKSDTSDDNKVNDSSITLTFYYYEYNDKDPTKPWELYSFDESKLDEIQYKCIHQDIQGFDPSYTQPLRSKSNTIGHKVTILPIDIS